MLGADCQIRALAAGFGNPAGAQFPIIPPKSGEPNLTEDYFPDSIQIVDWYHAAEHLAQATSVLHADDEAAAKRWNRARRGDLYLGRLANITTPLGQANLSSLATVFPDP
jgi:hypothetical protein